MNNIFFLCKKEFLNLCTLCIMIFQEHYLSFVFITLYAPEIHKTLDVLIAKDKNVQVSLYKIRDLFQ